MRALVPLTVLLVAAGCDAASPAGEARLAVEEARLVAAEIDAAGISAVDGGSAGFHASTSAAPTGDAPAAVKGSSSATFTRSRECRGGGGVTVSGTMDAAWDTELRSWSARIQASKVHQACTVPLREGRSITLDGAPELVLTATRARLDGAPHGLQTTTTSGAVRFATSDGRAGTCRIELASTFDPAAGTHRVTGTVCGRTVDVTRTRAP